MPAGTFTCNYIMLSIHGRAVCGGWQATRLSRVLLQKYFYLCISQSNSLVCFTINRFTSLKIQTGKGHDIYVPWRRTQLSSWKYII